MRKIKYVEALREAQWEEMRRDDRIFMFGEGIGLRGGCFTQTRGMWPEFGAKRLIDVPLSEPGFTGSALLFCRESRASGAPDRPRPVGRSGAAAAREGRLSRFPFPPPGQR